MNLDGKSILILGFGLEGTAMLKFLQYNAKPKSITIADKNSNIERDNYIDCDFILGDDYDKYISNYDVVIKSPGVKLDGDFISQTAIFLDMFAFKTVGVTGTKGKSTTSALISHILKHDDESTLLIGNMGIPALSKYEEAKAAKTIVYEMSSHQLLNIKKAPHISVLLNFYQEHLDYYNSYEDYMLAKCNIFRYHDNNDMLVYNADSQLVIDHIGQDYKGQLYAFSSQKHNLDGCYIDGKTIVCCINGNKEIVIEDINIVTLRGKHNLLNVMAAVIVSKLRGVSNNIISQAVSSFKSLPHRLEYVGRVDEVEFYNDSIATIPEATMQAVESLKYVDTLILGGFDRGIDYDTLMEYIIGNTSISNIIFTGDAGKRMLCLLTKYIPFNKNLMWLENYEDIVSFAKRVTRKNKICLLSPAAASYDMFKNFEERGTKFKELVLSNINN